MSKLMIVDDEIYAVEGIRDGIDWKAAGFDEVYSAYNAQEAVRLFREHGGVDVLICDIEMPGMSGLELAKWVSLQYPETMIVMLTCHAEFAFAQEAIRFGSHDYLLKPVESERLLEVVSEALEVAKAERQTRRFQEILVETQALWNKRKPLLQDRFWQELLELAPRMSEEQIVHALELYQMDLTTESRVLPVLLGIEQWTKEISAGDEAVMEYAVRKTAEEIVFAEGRGIAFRSRNGASLLILYADRSGGLMAFGELKRRCQILIETCASLLFCELSCYIGETGWLADAAGNVETLLSMEQNNVFRPRSVLFHKSVQEEPHRAYRVPSFSEWSELFEKRDEAASAGLLDATLAEMDRHSPLSKQAIERYFNELMQAIYFILHKRGISAYLTFKEEGLPTAGAPRSLAQLHQWSGQLIAATLERMKRRYSDEQANIVGRCMAYIRDNLQGKLSREELAAYVHLNPAYLSRLFRKETGEALTDYILRKRMELAKEQLENTKMPISQIARSFGYTNFSHFTKMFRKVHQENPQQFRRK